MRKNPFSLEGKNILITGASSGIGRATAIQCSDLGANIIATGRDHERLTATISKLNGGTHLSLVADLTTEAGLSSLVDQSLSIDGFVHCAGVNDKCLFKYIDKEKIDHIFDINCFLPMLLLNKLLRKKKINKGASIVLLSSISSNYATISNALYASSKGAINSLVRVLALELSSHKIRVNGVMPGMVNTSMINAYGLSQEELNNVSKSYPLGRLGNPEDIAYGIIYLLSDASCWVTGTSLVIDGGVTLR